ncbi:DNA polymerase [Boudabousia liubingyangii]|uniref:DNA polymerase n=1 Tax=Boudabousia liubingyangii TaxID=1921764 RepID=UPI00093CB467|nr:DNA polymerase [Boudabousia liubingyangii]OKL46984.1 DNA polymerase [Boudabousia liubingyangii]
MTTHHTSLTLDIETFSEINLGKAGMYRYAADPTFELLLLSYSWDAGPVQTIDIASGEPIPADVLAALDDPAVTKWAFNAAFERTCLSAHLGRQLSPRGWRCHMVWAAALGLPLSLDGVSKALKLNTGKLSTGKDLIRFFSVPAKPSLLNNGLTRNLPGHAPDKWGQFKTYNARDVETELELHAKLSPFPLPEQVWREYWDDQTINDRGIHLDLDLANAAIELDKQVREKNLTRSSHLTGLDNPNSPLQLKDWANQRGITMGSMGKQEVQDTLTATTDPVVKEVLALRLELSKSSVRKYEAMTTSANPTDHRARGLMQFHGAARTGRWAGRLIQVQNLPRNYLPDLDAARALVKDRNLTALEMLYDSVPDVLRQLIRTAFTPRQGYEFIVADYSAIEARVIAWLAGEESTLQVFKEGRDLYCETASRMFGVPVEKHGVNSHLRQKGKLATLGCGYGGSVGALENMGALRIGLQADELPGLVNAWREANPAIVDFWWAIDAAAQRCLTTGRPASTHEITFTREAGILFCTLPSGRRLAYPGATITTGRFSRDVITYQGQNTAKRWDWIETYGPKLVENIVQATARDLLAHAIRNVEAKGWPVVMHVHDEIIIEVPKGALTVGQVALAMCEAPDWAAGFPLDADGYRCDYYRKD